MYFILNRGVLIGYKGRGWTKIECSYAPILYEGADMKFFLLRAFKELFHNTNPNFKDLTRGKFYIACNTISLLSLNISYVILTLDSNSDIGSHV